MTVSRVGNSGTTAKSRKRKFVPSSQPGPFAVVASSKSFSSEQEHFTHGMFMTALIRSSDVKIEPIVFYEGINNKVFRRSIAFAIALVVTPRSSSFEYIISVHAVHAGAERNVVVPKNELGLSCTCNV